MFKLERNDIKAGNSTTGVGEKQKEILITGRGRITELRITSFREVDLGLDLSKHETDTVISWSFTPA